jgi:hypothetical protein
MTHLQPPTHDEGSSSLHEHLKALELRVAHLEHAIHPEQLAKEIAKHVRGLSGATHSERTQPIIEHEHKG